MDDIDDLLGTAFEITSLMQGLIVEWVKEGQWTDEDKKTNFYILHTQFLELMEKISARTSNSRSE